MAAEKKKNKQIWTGTVVSDKMEKTVVVKVERVFRNERTGKVMRTNKKYKVHDAQEQAKVGDVVTFHLGAPLSKTKCMYLDSIVSQG